MKEIRRVLCPIDFSDFSRHALDHAVAVTRRYRSTLTLLHVCPLLPVSAFAPGLPIVPVSVPTPGDLEALLVSMKHFADTEVGASVPMQYEIGEGDAATEILERATATPSDLIVMGTHGRSGFERLLLGSVTEKVIHKATCPVLTVPRRMADAVPASPVLFTRILCAIDFSDASLNALEYALSLGQEPGADLTLVHVVEVSPAPESEARGDAEARALGAYVAAAAHARAEHLQQIVPDNIRTRCRVEAVLAIGSAHREILRIAAERESDIIVLGAHGFGIAQRLFGSAAHQVVRQARCPVLTIR
jgi:nucleotide-binding universal stress UspA family protein